MASRSGILVIVAGLACACEGEAAGSAQDGGGGADASGAGDPGAGASGAGASGAGASGAGASGPTTTGPGTCDGGPLAAPLPGCAPTPPASTGDPHQDCVDRINQFRWECQCLPPLVRWTEAEGCTDQQSADDQAADAPHGHFPACGENAQNTCPNWGSEADVVGGCLQLMWDEGPGEPFEEHGHYINMSSLGYTKVACGFSTSAAGTWSNQNFAP